MSVLKDILKESKQHYIESKNKIEKKLSLLPKGSVKEREISGRKYYYLQYRVGKKIKQKYLGKVKPENLIQQLREKRLLKAELCKVGEALIVLKRSEGRRHG